MAPTLRLAACVTLLWGALLASAGRAQPQQVEWPEHPSRTEAIQLAQQAGAAMQAQDWVKAAEASQALIVICERELPDAPAYEAMAQNYLGIAYAYLGNHKAGLAAMVRSAELYEQALPAGSPHLQTVFDSGRDAAFAAEDWDMAWHFEEKMNGLFEQLAEPTVFDARLWESAERWAGYRQARPALELVKRRAQRITKRMGAEHPEAVAASQRVGYIAMQLDDYETAIEVLSSLVPAARAMGDEQANLRMAVLNELAEALRGAARWKEASPLYDEAFAGLSNAKPGDWDALATLHNNRGLNRKALGDLEGAADDLTRAIFFRRQIGADDAMLAYPLNNRGNLYRVMGLLDAAVADLKQALALRRRHDGTQAPTTATTLLNLALVEYVRLDHRAAERYFTASHQAYLVSLGPEHPRTANARFHLGRLKHIRSDYAGAIAIYNEVAPVMGSLPAGHAFQTSYMKALLEVLLYTQQFRDAERVVTKLADDLVAARGQQTIDYSEVLGLAAIVDWQLGRKRRARQRVSKAQEIVRKLRGAHDIDSAQHSLLLVRWDLEEERYTRALRRCHALIGLLEGVDLKHHDLPVAYAALGEAEHGLGNDRAALEALRHAKRLFDARLSEWLLTGTFEERGAMHSTYDVVYDIVVDWVQQTPSDQEALGLLVELEATYRGMAVTSSTQRYQQLRRSPATRGTLKLLVQKRARLTALALGTQQGAEGEREHLEASVVALERSLAFSAAGRDVQLTHPTTRALRDALPPSGRFIHFLTLWSPSGEWTLFALTFGHDGPVELVKLTTVEAISQQLIDFRRLAGDPQSHINSVRRHGRALYDTLLRPILREQDNVSTLVIGSTNVLYLLPWTALTDDQDRWLGERYAIVTGDGPRELIARPPTTSSRPLIIASPQFGEPGEADLQRWSGLPGTLREARAIERLLDNADIRLGDQATERALFEAKSPRVLHVATHGYFFRSAQAVADTGVRLASARGFKAKGKRPTPRPVGDSAAPSPRQVLDADSMVRSGLAMAFANEGGTSFGDGLVSGLEATSLQLSGTELVVLSACETGIGDVDMFAGVAGLRRAFAIAGAKSQVMSLWSVDDDATRQLMERFYKELIQEGAPRGEALRRAQLEVMQTKGTEHPYYWAAFILSGDWRPLPAPAKQ
jgi:CHAT domain-containing protein/tetratricopeptide (TPR) repeat protein